MQALWKPQLTTRGDAMNTDDRLREIELSNTRQEEKLRNVEHDAKNTRSMLTSLGQVFETRHAQLETDIKALSKTLFSIGLSLVGSIMTLLIAVVAYFMLERSNMIIETHDKAVQQQQQEPTK